MPLWRCPHCGIPQVESSRCWVCRCSTTSCAACRHFRRGIAPGLGVCGLDPRRLALRGTEMRACWEAAETTGAMGGADDLPPVTERVPVTAASAPAREAASGYRATRTFVPVANLLRAPDAVDLAIATEALVEPPATRRIPGGWSLWGDLEAQA